MNVPIQAKSTNFLIDISLVYGVCKYSHYIAVHKFAVCDFQIGFYFNSI